MQILKAGLVLYLHGKKRYNKCKYMITIFLLNRTVLYSYDKVSQATSSFVKTFAFENEILHKTDQ